MRLVLSALVLLLILCVGSGSRAVAQQTSDSEFDDLARRASAALDSRPEEASALYRQALAMRPSWAEGWMYLGASLYESKRYAEARDAFRHGISLAPDKGTAWAFLGLCESELGDNRGAMTDMQKGEALGLGDNQGFVSAVRTRAARILIQSSEFEAAMEQLQPLAGAGDDSPAVIEAYGLSALAMRSVVAEKRTLVSLAGRAAWALIAQRQSEAAELYRQLITTYPKEPGVHYMYGMYLLASDPDAALNQFREELQLNPLHVFARLQIASLLLKGGNPSGAMKPASEAVTLAPGNFLSHGELGRAYLSLGQLDRAAKELETAVKLSPENAQMHFYLEQAYRRAGRKEDAAKEKAEFARLTRERDPLSMPNAVR